MKKSLRKGDRLRYGAEFARLRECGTKYVGKYFLLVVADSPDSCLHCGVICSKKYSLLAVKRNRARRLLWESLRLMKGYLTPVTVVLIARRKLMSCKRQDVTMELLRLAREAGIADGTPTNSALEC